MFRGLRARLLGLVSVALIPLSVFSVAGIVYLSDAQRDDFERALGDVVRAFSGAVDNELHRSMVAAQLLAASPALVQGELDLFKEFSRTVLAQQSSWKAIALLTPQGETLFTLGVPGSAGPALPAGVPDLARAERDRVHIGNVVSAGGQYIFTVQAPVVAPGGQARYVVSLSVRPESLQEVLQRQAIPPDATVAVLDRERRIVARSRRHEDFVGKSATASLQRIMTGRAEGAGYPETLDGRRTYAAFSTSPETGWSVVIGLPLEQVGASRRNAYAVLTMGLLLSVGLGALAAFWVSRGIVSPIEGLRQSARGIARGDEVQPSTEGFREVMEVSQALAAASRTLRDSSDLRAMVLRREQEARAEAENASREKDEFLAMLSHELRNPLAAISSGFEVLRRLPVQSDQTEAMRRVVDRQLAHLRYLINDLLDVSRAVTGKIVLQTQVADLSQCVRHALSELGDAEVIRSHRIDMDLDPAWSRLDTHRMQQVASNLITNAGRYSAHGSRVAVKVWQDEQWATLEVEDEGIGMDEATRARVFDLFYQGAVAPHRPQGGLGVGLTLTRRLVELHGGTIEAHSAGPGRGSRFVVRLPRHDPPPHAISGQPARPPGPLFQRVLVVDDNRDHADSLALLLRMQGYSARVAYDGAQALAESESAPADLVLLDIGLPELDGYEVCRRLRARPGGHRIRIIALTGWGQASDREKSRAAGFDAHLTKPVHYEELVDAMQSADRGM